MITKLFSVFDCKLQSYTSPTCFQTIDVAIRSFGDAVRAKDSPFHAHPTDFSFYYLGEFNDETGVFVSLDRPQCVSHASDFVAVGSSHE